MCFPAVSKLVLLAVLAVAAVRVLVPGMLGKWCTNVGCGRRRDESDCALLLLISACCCCTAGSATPSATPWAASTTLPDSTYASLGRSTYHDGVHAASVRRAIQLLAMCVRHLTLPPPLFQTLPPRAADGDKHGRPHPLAQHLQNMLKQDEQRALAAAEQTGRATASARPTILGSPPGSSSYPPRPLLLPGPSPSVPAQSNLALHVCSSLRCVVWRAVWRAASVWRAGQS